ncbi:MAG: sigma-70 family RNA polymerase sigma factor [Prosthecobacter sp.]
MTRETPTLNAAFPATRWSVVLSASAGNAEEKREALAVLCQCYWYPLYAFARRRGLPATDAQDVTQTFFSHMLEARVLERLEGPERGRLRSYLLAGMQNWIARQHRDRNVAKRGGGRVVSFDALDAEERYRMEPADNDTPESLYEKHWALSVLEQAFVRLREDYASAGKGGLTDVLIPQLGRGEKLPMADIARRLDVGEGHARVLLHRMRKHLRNAVVEIIREATDGSADVVDDELAHFREILTR